MMFPKIIRKFAFCNKQNQKREMEISELYKIFLQHPQVTTDSRNCPDGSIFFALKGDSFNGNAYAKAALGKGCAFAIIDEEEFAEPDNERIILTDDCLKTLQLLANYHRRTLGTKIIGITGTNGKTTTKELISAVLQKTHNVLFTEGNFNNHIGVPKTLLRLTKDNDIAVVEMGANHPGEIETLVNIAEPDYGLITNVGKAHLLGFGSFEGVIKTKGELYDFLRNKKDSIVFINHFNEHLQKISDGLKLIEYGAQSDESLTVNGEVISCAPFLKFKWRHGNGVWQEVQTHLIGSYNIDNMMAAACIGLYFGVSPEQIDDALCNYIPSNNRSQLEVTAHNKLIIDAYNANPTSMMAALKNFRDMEVSRKMAILGDMRELGDVSADEHQKITDFLKETGITNVWLVGEEFGKTDCDFRKFANVEEVEDAIREKMPEDYYILIKGSNGIKLFQLTELL